MTYPFRSFMHRQMAVIRLLLNEHHLEQDTVADLLERRGQYIRDSVQVGMPAESIANEVASCVSK